MLTIDGKSWREWHSAVVKALPKRNGVPSGLAPQVVGDFDKLTRDADRALGSLLYVTHIARELRRQDGPTPKAERALRRLYREIATLAPLVEELASATGAQVTALVFWRKYVRTPDACESIS